VSAFGETLKRLRTARGFTQTSLAQAAKISRGSVAKLEAGTYSPSWETVVSLAKALEVSTEEFLDEPPASRHSA
jgi:transcriptional regulator with XRE-family HTH domain